MSRIRGQEIELILIQDGAPIQNLGFIKSTETTYKLELQQEGYIGETTDRYDSLFKGLAGNIEFHYDSPKVFTFIESIVDKARRRSATGTRVNLKQTWNFSAGRRARVLVPDIEFGEIPLGFGSRGDYGTFKVTFGASEAFALKQ